MNLKAMDKKQSGVALAVSMVLLLVITLVVISGGRGVLMQEKMVSAQRDGHLALSAAESGVRDAANILASIKSSSISWSQTGAGGYFSKGYGPIDVFETDSSGDWQSGNYQTASTNYGSDASQNAQFYFEQLGPYTGGTASSSTGASDLSLGTYDITNDAGGSGSTSQTLVKVVVRAMGQSGTSERIVAAYFPMND